MQEVDRPIGDFIISNAKGTQTENGVYYHYSDVCRLLKNYEKKLLIPRVVSSATSRDYTRLYEKISKGEIVPCFVDYDWRDGTPPFRDIARVRRRDKADIDIGARGISYGGVSNYDLKNKTELKAFMDECERMNLEYYT